MTIFKRTGQPTPASIVNEITRIEQRTAELENTLNQRRRELEAARETATQQVAAGADVEAAARTIAGLREVVEMTAAATQGLRQQRAELLQGLPNAKAQVLRAEAADLDEKVNAILAKAQPHLSALSKVMGVQYTEAILFAEPVVDAGWVTFSGVPMAECNPLERQAVIPRYVAPKAATMRRQAVTLLSEAASLESTNFTDQALESMLAGMRQVEERAAA